MFRPKFALHQKANVGVQFVPRPAAAKPKIERENARVEAFVGVFFAENFIGRACGGGNHKLYSRIF